MLTKVYISGPITGMPDLNRHAFEAEAVRLQGAGVSYFNPHDIPPPPTPLYNLDLWRYYMRACVKEIPQCTEIRMLLGWERSSGAQWEKQIAEMLGLDVIFIN